MHFTVRARASFDATHHIEDHPGCGHRWDVIVHSRDYYNPSKGRLASEGNLHEALNTLVGPLWNRSLNEMLLGASPTPEGVATWVSEQLVAQFPDITQVEVQASYGMDVTMHREVRRVGGLV